MFMDVEARPDSGPLKVFPAESEPISSGHVELLRQGYMCFRLPFHWNPHIFLLLPDLTASKHSFAPAASFDLLLVSIKQIPTICFGKLTEGVRLSR